MGHPDQCVGRCVRVLGVLLEFLAAIFAGHGAEFQLGECYLCRGVDGRGGAFCVCCEAQIYGAGCAGGGEEAACEVEDLEVPCSGWIFCVFGKLYGTLLALAVLREYSDVAVDCQEYQRDRWPPRSNIGSSLHCFPGFGICSKSRFPRVKSLLNLISCENGCEKSPVVASIDLSSDVNCACVAHPRTIRQLKPLKATIKLENRSRRSRNAI